MSMLTVAIFKWMAPLLCRGSTTPARHMHLRGIVAQIGQSTDFSSRYADSAYGLGMGYAKCVKPLRIAVRTWISATCRWKSRAERR